MAGATRSVSPHLIEFTSSLVSQHHPVTSYIWNQGDHSVLIDPAGDLTPATVEQLGFPPVADILITHLQAEHAQGCFNFPAARVAIPAGDEYLTRGQTAYLACNQNWQPPWEWETRGNFKGNIGGANNERPTPEPLPVAHLLEPGSVHAHCQLIATPGHGKHALTLVASIDHHTVAFCGDVIYREGQVWNWFDMEWDYGLLGGYTAHQQSVAKLRQLAADLLCPSHGGAIASPTASLALLEQRLQTLRRQPIDFDHRRYGKVINFPEQDSPATGFRQLLPSLHQWRTGNCAVLISRTGNAMLFDDGLCCWEPLSQRRAHHDKVMAAMKHALGIRRIDLVIPTHYHGDHTENIPDIVATDNAQVACLTSTAVAIEKPDVLNVACKLPWYGTHYQKVHIDRHLRQGQKLHWHEFEIELFHLGGQTFYSLGAQINIDGVNTLFVGDAVGSDWPGVEMPICYNDAEPSTRGWSFAVDRMLERQPDLLVAGHGVAIRDPRPVLELKQQGWRIRMQQFDAINPRANRRIFFDPLL